jgi:hypothetical protein
MEFKGTKGKWKIKDIKSTLETEINTSEYRIAKVKHYKGKNFNDPIEKEAKFNALLISKAPEMLDYLMDAINENKSGEKISDGWFKNVEQLIKEATKLL